MTSQPFKRVYSELMGFILPKLKFALTSGVATAFDYVLYLILFYFFFSPEVSNIISYSCAMVLNFVLQKKFVFSLKGKTGTVFLLSMFFSLIGLTLSTLMISGLNQFQFMFDHQYFTKVLVTGTIFFYNFYTKKFVFEGRL